MNGYSYETQKSFPKTKKAPNRSLRPFVCECGQCAPNSLYLGKTDLRASRAWKPLALGSLSRQRRYHEAFVTPGSCPFIARSRNAIRLRPNLR